MKKIQLIDYKNDFDYPETEVSFHWYDKNFVRHVSGTTVLHTHDYYEIFIMTRGHVDHILNGETSVLSKYDMQLILPSDVHQFLPHNEESSQHINLEITANMIKKLCDTFGDDFFDVISSKNTGITLNKLDYDFFLNQAEHITLSHVNDIHTHTMLIKRMLMNLLFYIYERQILKKFDSPEWFNNLISELHNPGNINYTAVDVYKLSNYSPAMILKYFKQYTGKNITEYLQDIKIQYACNLLEKTNFSTLAISGKLGFDSLSHFNHLFKKITAKTPREYRASIGDKVSAKK